jgi:hypothetical protein
MNRLASPVLWGGEARHSTIKLLKLEYGSACSPVIVAVFKTVDRYLNDGDGGFDPHSLPPTFKVLKVVCWPAFEWRWPQSAPWGYSKGLPFPPFRKKRERMGHPLYRCGQRGQRPPSG